MKRIFTSMVLFFASVVLINAEVITEYPVSSVYTVPRDGEVFVRPQTLPRMANEETRLLLRFDLFFFPIFNPDVSVENIEKAEVVVVSVLENGITGVSRRVNDSFVTVYETRNDWKPDNATPVLSPFEIRAISGPLFYPAMGANPYQQSEEDVTDSSFIDAYETPTRFDITDFFKEKLANPDEFSIDFVKRDEVGEFVRMGSVTNAVKAYHPRIEITLKGSGFSNPEINPLKVWGENGIISTEGKAGNYTIYSSTGQIIESTYFFDGRNSFSSKLNAGIYIVKCQNNENTFVSKVYVK